MYNLYNKIIRRSIIEYNNYKSFSTKRKILVFESDDWGSIRMPNKEIYNRLISKNIKFSLDDSFDKYDTLASENDLNCLIEILSSIKDKNDNNAKITLNTVVTNPNFEKIKASNYTEYYYEVFTETLKKYPNHKNSFKLWEKGISLNVFKPQFHGREHLNVLMWLNSLKENHYGVRDAFEENVFSVLVNKEEDERIHFLSAFNYKQIEDLKFLEKSFIEGLEIFFSIFGFKPKSMIAPCYTWDGNIEKIALSNGIKYIQSFLTQNYSLYTRKLNSKEYIYHYTGEKNNNNQIYLVRNCEFEPSRIENPNYLSCLKEIENAFNKNKPAIVVSHRINFIGGLDIRKRDRNLKLLKDLLNDIVVKWPDVEFMFSDELGDLIDNNQFNSK